MCLLLQLIHEFQQQVWDIYESIVIKGKKMIYIIIAIG